MPWCQKGNRILHILRMSAEEVATSQDLPRELIQLDSEGMATSFMMSDSLA